MAKQILHGHALFIMRIIKELVEEDLKISFFQYNGKYLVKFEKGPLEQTFKYQEWDVPELSCLEQAVVLPAFLNEVRSNFDQMIKGYIKTMNEL